MPPKPKSSTKGRLATAKSKKLVIGGELSPSEEKALMKYEKAIRVGAMKAQAGFRKMAEAFHQIKTRRLYRGHGTFTEYFQQQCGYGRSHANRIADAGEIIELSPRGDILQMM